MVTPPSTPSSQRKRKKPTQFYGYDPSIYIMPGDPRLMDPWYGINFHKNQPVNNAFRDWSGEGGLFDISKNQPKQVSNSLSFKKRMESSTLYYRRPKNLLLHRPQPVTNQWTNWADVDPFLEGQNQRERNLVEKYESGREININNKRIELLKLKAKSILRKSLDLESKNGSESTLQPIVPFVDNTFQQTQKEIELLRKLDKRKTSMSRTIAKKLYIQLLEVEAVHYKLLCQRFKDFQEGRIDFQTFRKGLMRPSITQANMYRHFAHIQANVRTVALGELKTARGALLKNPANHQKFSDLVLDKHFLANIQKDCELETDAFLYKTHYESILGDISLVSTSIHILMRCFIYFDRILSTLLTESNKVDSSLLQLVINTKLVVKLLRCIKNSLLSNKGALKALFETLLDKLTEKQIGNYFLLIAKQERTRYYSS